MFVLLMIISRSQKGRYGKFGIAINLIDGDRTMEMIGHLE